MSYDILLALRRNYETPAAPQGLDPMAVTHKQGLDKTSMGRVVV
jgi:hypothetical protein